MKDVVVGQQLRIGKYTSRYVDVWGQKVVRQNIVGFDFYSSKEELRDALANADTVDYVTPYVITTFSMAEFMWGIGAKNIALAANPLKARKVPISRNAVNDYLNKYRNFELALGLGTHPGHGKSKAGLLFRFIGKLNNPNVKHYWQLIKERGWENARTAQLLTKQLTTMMKETKHIHMNLDGLLGEISEESIKHLLKKGSLGIQNKNITKLGIL